MNNAKMWLVVKPTVGVPLFLSAVAVGSFAVHVAVLSNTTWVADFLSGQPLGSGSAAIEAPATNNTNQLANDVKFAPSTVPASIDGQTAHIVLQDGTIAKVTLKLTDEGSTQVGFLHPMHE